MELGSGPGPESGSATLLVLRPRQINYLSIYLCAVLTAWLAEVDCSLGVDRKGCQLFANDHKMKIKLNRFKVDILITKSLLTFLCVFYFIIIDFKVEYGNPVTGD